MLRNRVTNKLTKKALKSRNGKNGNTEPSFVVVVRYIEGVETIPQKGSKLRIFDILNAKIRNKFSTFV